MTATVFRSLSEASHFVQPSGSRREDYFGRTSGIELGPEAFLVDLREHTEVRTHFHSVDQFQVMFGTGGATYKNDLIPSVLIHYADKHTTYGPFAAAADRLRFLTLRAEPTSVTSYMPESRAELPEGTKRRRHFLADLDSQLAEPMPAVGQHDVQEIFADPTGEVSAALLRVGPDTDFELPAATPGGRFNVILTGGFFDESGVEYGPMSLGWTDTDDTIGNSLPVVRSIRTGVAGCQGVSLQFPPNQSG
jgi:hypothetical protein